MKMVKTLFSKGKELLVTICDLTGERAVGALDQEALRGAVGAFVGIWQPYEVLHQFMSIHRVSGLLWNGAM